MTIISTHPKRTRWAVLFALLFLFGGIVTVIGAGTAGSASARPGPVTMVPESFTQLAEMVGPAVVNIRTVKTVKGGGPVFRHFQRGPFGDQDQFRDFFEKFFGGEEPHRDFKQRSLGSGFIIDPEGFIVTNNHVIEDADEIRVILKDEKEYDAKVVGRDPNTDLALIKIQDGKNFPVMPLGDSDALKVGQWVVAIGSPFGLEQTVTAGIVSAKGRVIGSGPYDDFIQTDASINPGNSGGPLLNMNGEVIGINTAIIASGQGIGFAIPINMAKGIIAQLKETGEVTRGWLGVGIQPLSQEMREYYRIDDDRGVLVSQVFPGDPADKAGIQAKDIIIAVNGQKISDARDLTGTIASLPVGSTAKIVVLRDGKEKTINVTIAKREDERVATMDRKGPKEDSALGIRVSEITPEISRRFNLEDEEGIIVVDVSQGSKADEAGLEPGDIIKEVNRKDIRTVKDFESAISAVDDGDAIQMFVRRQNMGFLVVKIMK
ncbi:MAG: DegQ family serine endoprotease [Desulfobacterales bacterium]|jgi:serine protease Do